MAVAGLTVGACLLSSAGSLRALWAAAPAAGFAFGCHWSLMPPLAGELFGMRSFASLYCLLQFGTTFGTYAFATKLVRTSLSVFLVCPKQDGCAHSSTAMRTRWLRPPLDIFWHAGMCTHSKNSFQPRIRGTFIGGW